jgi:transketolase
MKAMPSIASEKINDIEQLDNLAKQFRWVITDIICRAGSGHLGGALSLVEILITLYYRVMNIRSQEPDWPERDRFVLSKGHAGPVLYTTLAYKGYFPMDWLLTLNKNGTNLPSHVDQTRTPGVDMTAGSLGQGLSCALGMALAAKVAGRSNRVFCVIGDGESQEGQIWEAAMFAAHYKLDNLVAVCDFNKLQIDGPLDGVMSLGALAEKWQAFGWQVFEIKGHDWEEIYQALQKAIAVQGKPAMIVAHTIKCKGNACFEGLENSHHVKVSSPDEYQRVLKGVCNFDEMELPY